MRPPLSTSASQPQTGSAPTCRARMAPLTAVVQRVCEQRTYGAVISRTTGGVDIRVWKRRVPHAVGVQCLEVRFSPAVHAAAEMDYLCALMCFPTIISSPHKHSSTQPRGAAPALLYYKTPYTAKNPMWVNMGQTWKAAQASQGFPGPRWRHG